MGPSNVPEGRDVAADTVIGFVLVTGISLVMISVVMLMGAPALEQVQSRQQMDSMVGTFHRLDRGVSTLLSGAPAGTAPSWQVSMADGSLSLDQGGDHLWGYVVNFKRDGNRYQFWFGSYADGDGEIEFENTEHSIAAGDFDVEAYRYEGGERTDIQTMSDPATIDLNWHLAENTTQIKLFDRSNEEGNQTVAEAWFIDGGAVEWQLSRGGQMMRLMYQNTGIIADIDDGQVRHNSPRLRAPEDAGDGTEDIFVRIVKLEGAIAVGGRSTSEMVLSSEGNHARFSTGNADQVQIYPPTSTITAWERYLTNEPAGFPYEWSDGSGSLSVLTGKEAVAHYTSSEKLSTTLVETEVEMSRSGGS